MRCLSYDKDGVVLSDDKDGVVLSDDKDGVVSSDDKDGVVSSDDKDGVVSSDADVSSIVGAFLSGFTVSFNRCIAYLIGIDLIILRIYI